MRTLDVRPDAGQITPIMARLACRWWVAVTCLVIACRGGDNRTTDSTRTLAPVFPAAPGENSNWNAAAGPLMIIAVSGSTDSAMVVLPYVTDSTIGSLQGVGPPISGMTFDLFGRSGKVSSSVAALPLPPTDTTRDCYAWPAAKLQLSTGNWEVGFLSGRAHAIPLDSIETLSSRDSASLTVSITQAAATLTVADPTFRGLPFRVRSAYTFQLDTVDVVVADLVRTVNEEAKPRVEHLLIFGERPHNTNERLDVTYFSRNAGPEDTTPVTEILAAVKVGTPGRPIVIVNVQYDDGGKLGFVERNSGKWSATWRSAYTDCQQ